MGGLIAWTASVVRASFFPERKVDQMMLYKSPEDCIFEIKDSLACDGDDFAVYSVRNMIGLYFECDKALPRDEVPRLIAALQHWLINNTSEQQF